MMTDTSPVTKFYDQNPSLEHARLEVNPIDYVVTMATITQTLEKLEEPFRQCSRILDLGGGTGRYAVALAQQGHQVTLADISAAELETAKQYAAEKQVQLENVVAVDAREVRQNPSLFKRDYYDIVLCLGPFYHLLAEEERLQLLQDCISMTKPGGFVLTAFVTIYAHLRDVAKKDPKRLTREKEFYATYLQTGQYTRSLPMHHTTAEEIRQLFAQVEDLVEFRRMIAPKSFLAGRMDTELRTLSKEEFQPWADLALRFTEDPHTAGAADHILVVAQKC